MDKLWLVPALPLCGFLLLTLLPLALGTSSLGDMRYYPLARTVMGGLLSSTFLTLLVLPTYYTMFDDLARWLKRLWRNSSPGEREPAAEPALGD